MLSPPLGRRTEPEALKFSVRGLDLLVFWVLVNGLGILEGFRVRGISQRWLSHFDFGRRTSG